MNTTAVLAVLLILAVVILVGNTLIAVAFLRGRKNNPKSFPGADNEALDELHKRVQGLTRRPK
jgi:hypothetical protein